MQFKISLGNILGLFTRTCGNKMRHNGFELTEGRLRLVVRNKSFIQRVMRHWHSLPREIGSVPFLEVLKARLDWGAD